ncbi:unnamed protein product [Mucor hiemalis]
MEVRWNRNGAAALAWTLYAAQLKDLYLAAISSGIPTGETSSIVNEKKCPKNGSHDIKETEINLFFLYAHETVNVYHCACTPLIETLKSKQMFPASVKEVQKAVHFGVLELILHAQVVFHSTVTGWAKLLNERNDVDINKLED